MKIHEAVTLVTTYGPDITLGELLKQIQGRKVHKCPKCNGTGEITEEYNGYPSGLPDSGWVYEPAYRTVTCDLCKGEGYTGKLMKPRMIQDGWEEEE